MELLIFYSIYQDVVANWLLLMERLQALVTLVSMPIHVFVSGLYTFLKVARFL